jgi:hypothetical protein
MMMTGDVEFPVLFGPRTLRLDSDGPEERARRWSERLRALGFDARADCSAGCRVRVGTTAISTSDVATVAGVHLESCAAIEDVRARLEAFDRLGATHAPPWRTRWVATDIEDVEGGMAGFVLASDEELRLLDAWKANREEAHEGETVPFGLGATTAVCTPTTSEPPAP